MKKDNTQNVSSDDDATRHDENEKETFDVVVRGNINSPSDSMEKQRENLQHDVDITNQWIAQEQQQEDKRVILPQPLPSQAQLHSTAAAAAPDQSVTLTPDQIMDLAKQEARSMNLLANRTALGTRNNEDMDS